MRLEEGTLFLSGDWSISGLGGSFPDASFEKVKRIDLSGVSRMDTYGALFVVKVMERNGLSFGDLEGLSPEFERLIKIVAQRESVCPKPKREPSASSFGYRYLSFFDFVGRLFLEGILRLRDFEPRSFFNDVQNMGLRALPIIGVLSFLIGVVIAYQSASQLARFGANIFIVDLVVLSVVRELAPLIVAVLISGRSASSYTATLGLMKVNEEIDFLEVMGVSPYASLVLPRILSLTAMTPLLVVFADLVGIAGGMLVANGVLGIGFGQFIRRMEAVLLPHHFWAGVVKAPFFGFFVALVGTWKGFSVEKRAESVGFNVIESVVMSLFGVIVIDAVFSVVYRWLGI